MDRRTDYLNTAKLALWIMDRAPGEANSFSTEEACEALGMSEFEFRLAMQRIEKFQGLAGVPSVGRVAREDEDA